MFRTAFLVAFFVFTIFTNAKTYYVDFTGGNDSYNGTSQESAWKSLDKVNSFSFQPGDTLLFKRGEIWQGYFEFSSSGSSTDTIIIGSYGTGELPVITGRGEYENWNSPFEWKEFKTNIWEREQPFNPQRLWINGKEVLRNEILDSVDGTRYGWAWENEKLYVYSNGNPATTFSSMVTNLIPYTVKITRTSNYVVLQDIEIQGGYSFALNIEGCHNTTVRRCKIGAYSRQGIIVWKYGDVPAKEIVIENCELDSKFNFSYGKDKGIDDGILLTAGAQNCVIKNNAIRDFGHCAIYLKSLSPGYPGVMDNKIFGNLISGEHVTYLHGIGTDGPEGECSRNEFYDNLIIHTTVRSQINGDNNWIHHNIVYDVKNAVARSYSTAQGFDLECYGDNFVCHDNKIDNNLIMNCDEPGIFFRDSYGPKYNNYVRNNIILNCGRNSKDGFNGVGIVIQGSNTILTNFFYNNCVYSGDTVSKVIYERGKLVNTDEFNSNNGFQDIAKDNIQNDPSVFTFDYSNFYIRDNSPCVDAGLDIGLKFDYYGNKIYSGKAPDIGIQEIQQPDEVVGNGSTPKSFKLYQNYPNPFGGDFSSGKPATTIRYSIPVVGTAHELSLQIQLTVYDLLGRKVATLINERQSSGLHSVQFNAKDLPSGFYFYTLRAGNFSLTKKMILVK